MENGNEAVKDAEKRNRTISEQFDVLLMMPPKDFVAWLDEEFYIKIPVYVINSIEDMNEASRLLVILTNRYSYLSSFLSYAKIAAREAKRSGDKEAYEDMVDRRDAVENMTNSVKQQYSAVSRAVTIHNENNAELRMNESGTLKER